MVSVEVVREIKCGDKVIVVAKGDITLVECDAVVNPANSLMIMGGGVAGALRRAAGEEVEIEARHKAPVPVGKAVTTSAGKLVPRIKKIIHAPTMERPAMRTTRNKVVKAAKAALEEAARQGVECIAFPALGAGVGGLTANESLEAMLEALDEYLASAKSSPQKIIFIAYSDADIKQFLKTLERIRLKSCEKLSKPGIP